MNLILEITSNVLPQYLLNFRLELKHAIFRLKSKRSRTLDPKVDIPEIEVTFINGITKKLILNHHDAIPNSVLIDRSRLCNYLGHLEGDEMNSIVAVTGCLIGDEIDEKMHITILSPHSPNHKTFSVDKNGKTKHIKIEADYKYMSFFDQGYLSNSSVIDKSKSFSGRYRRDYMRNKNNPFINEDWEVDAKRVTAEERSVVPKYLALNIRLGYDKSVKDYFKKKGTIVDEWLSEVMTHVQDYFFQSSLKHKIILQVRYNEI